MLSAGIEPAACAVRVRHSTLLSYAQGINGDAFSDAVKAQVVDTLKRELGPVDLVVYSIAAPRRTDPRTGITYTSALKPIGRDFTAKTLDTDRKLVNEVTLTAATEDEIKRARAKFVARDEDIAIDDDARARRYRRLRRRVRDSRSYRSLRRDRQCATWQRFPSCARR